VLRSAEPLPEWWRAFANLGLDGAKEAGRHCANVVDSSDEPRARAYDNLQDATLEMNEYWAEISCARTFSHALSSLLILS